VGEWSETIFYPIVIGWLPFSPEVDKIKTGSVPQGGLSMTVDELLASKELTPEEWELHKDLIEDCRKNEAMIAQNQAVTKQYMERMIAVLDIISVKMVELSVSLEKIIGDAEVISLKMLPENKFYRE
jgi:hypothetical protein